MERVNSSAHTPEDRSALLRWKEKGQIEKSGTYAACEQMIQMSFMVMQLATLDQILERFEKNGRLSSSEHQSLLQFAGQVWDKRA